MPKFAANLHYLFNEHPFLDRFSGAADAGFRGVEAQVPYRWPATDVAKRLEANGLEMVLIDTEQGNWDAGERGLAALPGREAEYMGIVTNGELYTTYGMRGFYLTSTAQAIEAIEAVNHPTCISIWTSITSR